MAADDRPDHTRRPPRHTTAGPGPGSHPAYPARVRVAFTLVGADARRRDVRADGEGPVRIADLLHAAGTDLPYPGAPVWVDGRTMSADELVHLTGPVPGGVLSLTGQVAGPAVPPDAAGRLHLAVTGGPATGTLYPLAPGRTIAGRARDCDICLPDPALSRRHLELDTAPDGTVIVSDLGSSNGTAVGGSPITEPVVILTGQAVHAGDTTMELRRAEPADAVVHTNGASREVRRPPRLLPHTPQVEIGWPSAPAEPTKASLPLATALVPLALGAVMFAVTHQALMLLFLLMSPVLAVTTFVTGRRSGRAAHRQAVAGHAAALAAAEAEMAAALDAERAARNLEHPDPARVLATVSGPRRRLWERRRGDEDLLDLRIGLATMPATVRRTGAEATAEQLEPVWVDGVPCIVSLRECGVVGVAGPAEVSGPLAVWLVAQQVALTGPADLRVVVLAEPRSGADRHWAWARWLPHVAPADDTEVTALRRARPAGTAEARARELVELVEGRLRAAEERRRPGTAGPPESGWPWVLVVLDPAHDLRRVPGVDAVLQRGPEVRVVALCIEESESHLPPECRTVVVADNDGRGVVRRSGTAPVTGVTVDRVAPRWADEVGRRLAPLHDPELRRTSGGLPDSVRLVDLLGLDGVGPSGFWADAIAQAWERSGRSTAAVIGVGPDGPLTLDLRNDGPHALVAGTTGAGKSELLQSLVASLAVANRPDALNLLLVDYKGGSAFRDCARLPHTVGVVTDLDGHLTERALVSLSAELKRREELLAHADAKDIEDYVTAGEPLGPLPRLLIVIDEFAGLVAELPDFVSGLVGIAQRGRSLGIHMVLATQRPSGVVSPEIRANTNLRVALRVTSPAESADIIDAPDAARISPATPGRAIALTGHSAPVQFQSARVGGPAASIGANTAATARVVVAPLDWTTAGRPVGLREPAATTAGEGDPSDTDLARLADALVGAAAAAGTGPQRQPWLAPLPDLLPRSELAAPGLAPAGDVHAVPIGLVDLPAIQQQVPLEYHLGTARHLIVAGSPGSGRTTALRTLAAALATGHRPDDLWLYAIDCGGGELRRLADLPHCGAVVTRSDTDRTDRLLRRLHAEMTRRLDLLARSGHTDLHEHRGALAPGERPPYIVVLVDRWEGFLSAFDQVDAGRLTDVVLDLAREGGSVGIRLVLSGDRQVLLGKLAASIEDRLCLGLADPADYSLAGFDARKVPLVMRPGRALRSTDQAELQIAVPGTAPSGTDQNAAIAALVAWWRDAADSEPVGAAAPGGGPWQRPFRIDVLPDKISLAEADQLASAERASAARRTGGHWALVGVGGDEISVAGADLAAAGGFVVAGPRRSGRSTALLVMARSLLDGRTSVLALCPRSSPLRQIDGADGVLGVVTGEEPAVSDVLALLNQATGPLAVLVDDAPLLHGTDVAGVLDMVARDGGEQGHVMVVAGSADELGRPMRGFIVDARQSRSGLLLCPETHLHGEIIGARLPRSAVFSRPVGRGVLVTGDTTAVVQVPLPT